MWRHRYSNQWIWHVQWTGTPERLNIRRGSALTKWSQKKKKKNPTPPPPHLFSLAQRRWKDSLVGLLHILPRLGKSGGHIPHSSPFSYSLRLSLFCPLLFFFFIYVFCWRWGGGTHGTIAGELLEKRTEWAAGTRKRFLELRRASVVIRALWNTRRSISFRLLRNVRSARRHGFG